jgi:N-methylhydantoinase A
VTESQRVHEASRYRLGIDIGGTFTDAILIDQATGALRIGKIPTTPTDPSVGFLDVARRLIGEAGIDPRQVDAIVHATTVATNAVIEGKTVKTGFVVTGGFRDLLEIARQIRPSLYDLQFVKPAPLVPRDQAFEVIERLDEDGQVLIPLDENSVRGAAKHLKSAGVEAVAVCLLHSYLNADHETRVAEILREALPGVSVSTSADIAREFREYFRASTTVVNAAVQPIVRRYLEKVTERLEGAGFRSALLVMQSGGGIMTFSQAARRPVYMIESGPAAGVVGSLDLVRNLDIADAISFDMGGTTAKVGLIEGGMAAVTKDSAVGAAATPGVGGVASGSGYPIRIPVIDLVEIGSGGGSIAWIDEGGRLRVGPQSAGADPGPACYQRGGVLPTVSDANLVLGRLSTDRFLNGEMTLSAELARNAIATGCADSLEMDVVDAAHAIVEIANLAMADAIRVVSVQRGRDPRDFALVSFGGAGPLHANRLASMLQIPQVIIPPAAGAFSALGLLVTDLIRDLSQTIRLRTDLASREILESAFDRLIAEGRREFELEGISATTLKFQRYAEMRYAGQSHELLVPVDEDPLGTDVVPHLTAAFHALHERTFGFRAETEPVVIVNLRASVISQIRRPSTEPALGAFRPPKPVGRRAVYFQEARGFVEADLYDRSTLHTGSTIKGPAIVQQHDTTCVVHPGYAAHVDEKRNLVLRPVANGSRSLSGVAEKASRMKKR